MAELDKKAHDLIESLPATEGDLPWIGKGASNSSAIGVNSKESPFLNSSSIGMWDPNLIPNSSEQKTSPSQKSTYSYDKVDASKKALMKEVAVQSVKEKKCHAKEESSAEHEIDMSAMENAVSVTATPAYS